MIFHTQLDKHECIHFFNLKSSDFFVCFGWFSVKYFFVVIIEFHAVVKKIVASTQCMATGCKPVYRVTNRIGKLK